MNASIAIRQATAEDLEAFVAIENAVFPKPFPRSFFQSELNEPNARFVCAQRGSRVVGYLDYREVLDEIQIIHLAVAPEHHRQGVGSFLFSSLPASARKIFLEVRVSNRAAIAFYEAKGFVSTGTRKRFYADGEDALLMTRDLSGDLR